MRKRFAMATLGLFAVLGAPGQVCAQATPADLPEVRRPYRGLFGSPGLVRGQSLSLSGSIYGAYDDNVYADQFGDAPASDLRQTGWYQGAQVSLVYGKRGQRIDFGANSSVALTRYPSRPVVAAYVVGARISGSLSRHTSLSVSESFVYSPEFRLSLFNDPNAPGGFRDPYATVDPDFGVFGDSSYRTDTNVSVTRTLRTGTLDGYYSLVSATSGSGTLDYSGHGAGVKYGRGLTRNTSLRLGYGYGVGSYKNTDRVQRGVHTLDVGLDYGRALSVSRRTHLAFSTGSALFYANQRSDARGGLSLHFALLGSASLTHELGRTWTSGVSYRRSVGFQQVFLEPVLSQAVSADIGGLLARRLRFSASASYTRGLVGGRSTDPFDTTGITSGLEYGLSRYLAAYVNYVYYQYGISGLAVIDPRFPERLDRDGIRLGLSTSIPLIRGK